MFKFVIKLRVVLRQPSIIDDINQQKFISGSVSGSGFTKPEFEPE